MCNSRFIETFLRDETRYIIKRDPSDCIYTIRSNKGHIKPFSNDGQTLYAHLTFVTSRCLTFFLKKKPVWVNIFALGDVECILLFPYKKIEKLVTYLSIKRKRKLKKSHKNKVILNLKSYSKHKVSDK